MWHLHRLRHILCRYFHQSHQDLNMRRSLHQYRLMMHHRLLIHHCIVNLQNLVPFHLLGLHRHLKSRQIRQHL